MAVAANHSSCTWSTKVLILTLVFGLIISLVAPAPNALAQSQASNSVDIVGFDKRFLNNVPRRERGRCTDVYSKAWCDAHGYKNNRPVGKVALNKKELDCLVTFYGSIGFALAKGIVSKTPTGAIVASASAAYSLWKCLK